MTYCQLGKKHGRAHSGHGRTVKHPFLGYHIEHSLSSVFFAAKMQESGFGIQEMLTVAIFRPVSCNGFREPARKGALWNEIASPLPW